jgi:hypothetical protein
VNVWLVMDYGNYYPLTCAVCLTEEIAEHHAAELKKGLTPNEAASVIIEEWEVEDS